MKATPNFWTYLALLLASMGITLSEAGLLGTTGVYPDGIMPGFVFSDLKPGDLRLALTQAR